MRSNRIRSRTVAVNGVGLDVLEAGDPGAPPVILAHGFPESSWSWRHQLPTLAEAGYHAIAPDQRGYGGSSRPGATSRPTGSSALCGDLLGLLDEAGHEQAVFVGHDWGALIVWDLARLHPERVRAVVGGKRALPVLARPADRSAPVTSSGDRFFYILYFQHVGPAEAELEADIRGDDGSGAVGQLRRRASGVRRRRFRAKAPAS